jgi:hypothetical protein
MEILFFNEPISGDTWSFSVTNCPNYPPGYTFTAVFAADQTTVTATGTLDGTGIKFTLTPAQTSSLPLGPVKIAIQVFDTANPPNRYTIKAGAVKVFQDISVSGEIVQAESVLSQQLRLCNDTLTAVLSNEVSVAQFGGQQYTMHNINDLYKVRNSLQSQVDLEDEENLGNRRSRIIKPRFVSGQMITQNPWGIGGW